MWDPESGAAKQRDAADRRTFGLFGIVTTVVIIGTFVALAFAIFGRGGNDTPAAVAPTSTPEASGAIPSVDGPHLLEPAPLRSAPQGDAAIITRLQPDQAIRVLGRSVEGDWLVIGPVDQPQVIGWVSAASVGGLDDLMSLSVVTANDDIAATPTGTPTGAPTLTPDLPDLRLLRAFSRENRLWVAISNEGAADALADIFVSVNDSEPFHVHPAPGTPIRPGEEFEAGIEGVYIQLRSPVLIALITDPPMEEESEDGNTWFGLVEPDLPNDIEVLSAALIPPDDFLRVTVRNNSPIPIQGNISVTIREQAGDLLLLGRQSLFVQLDIDGTIELDFDEITGVEIHDISARLTTDAIADADLSNNVYPR
jgi:hypothetical protein